MSLVEQLLKACNFRAASSSHHALHNLVELVLILDAVVLLEPTLDACDGLIVGFNVLVSLVHLDIVLG
jgi:hypothetical protein